MKKIVIIIIALLSFTFLFVLFANNRWQKNHAQIYEKKQLRWIPVIISKQGIH